MEEKKKVSSYEKLVEGIENIIDSGKYLEFLKAMKNFHSYSFSNRLLIYAQNPDATKVAGYVTWKNLGRGVKSNPKRIYIIKPIHYKAKTKMSEKEQQITPESLEEDDIKEKNKETEQLFFGWTIVYDIEDTYILDEEKIIPLLDDTLINNNSSKNLYDILLDISPVKVNVESTYNGSDGYYDKGANKIVIASRLSQDDRTATLLHEISHALYDDFDYAKERDLSEIFVESIAFIVADYFGLDTSKCSFSYITKWSKGDSKKILELGTKIQKASDDFIDKIKSQIYKEELKVA